MVLAFDIYGTLFDTRGVSRALQACVGERAAEVAHRWRDKQLEYSFRRGLMRQYRDFTTCTREALDYVCRSLNLSLDEAARQALLAAYETLPAFADVEPALQALQEQRVQMYAFSNGPAASVERLLDGAGLAEYFRDIVSVDEVRSFKPDPAVYAHFLQRAASSPAETWLVSANSFDVSGAAACGWQTVWLRRDPAAVSDPWEFSPDRVIPALTALATLPLASGPCQ
jgi:2-haloacid dehalogenase